MNTHRHLIQRGTRRGALAALAASLVLVTQADAAPAFPAANMAPSKSAAAIPWLQIGANTGANYQGEGLAVMRTDSGARLRCAFQRLEGEATTDGLWLASTVADAAGARFRVVASAVEREPASGRRGTVSRAGAVEVVDKVVRFVRPGLIEEYTVSMDGMRQDFLVMERPEGSGQLRVAMEVTGATAEPRADGALLVLGKSGRKIAYSRLRATDAAGRDLPARMEVLPTRLAVLVDDAAAVYPVRIDPTFSDANWVSMGGLRGANGWVNAVAADGSGDVYIGGNFTLAGEVFATNVAKWGGDHWSALGSGIHGEVYSLAVSGSFVYAGGYFTNAGGTAANYIAEWDGNNWSALGSGLNDVAYALAVSGSDLYAGGSFMTAGGSTALHIARWNGSSWSPLGLGVGGLYTSVSALAVSGSDLYVGGYFFNAGGSASNNIARWDGSKWWALGAGMNSNVNALAVSGTNLFAGGPFTSAGGSPANRVARWDGSHWSPLGSGIDGDVYSLAASGSELYAGGYFTNAGGTAASNVAKWDGSSWSALGPGVSGWVYAMAMSGTNLVVSGSLATAGSVARWDGTSWASLGSGMDGRVYVLAMSGTSLWAGGAFRSAGAVAVNGIAKWDGSSWSPLGLGMGMNGAVPSVHALEVSGTNVYAGGDFTYATNAGGSVVNANYIAEWDGSNWSSLGSGMDGSVLALAVSGGDLYAGGGFMTAGGIPAKRIARWDGGNWSALGPGIGDKFSYSHVYALAVSGTNLYAGGDFTLAGGSAANLIAKWDGTSWSPLGSGLSGSFSEVYALAVSGTNLYAGGYFTTADGNPANYIAKWNGNSWSALGSGLNSFVDALAVSGGDLFVGGGFTRATNAGGAVVAANRIARWNGSSWSALGSGMNGPVWALLVSGSDLYAGGGFTSAGGKVSAYMARAYLELPSLSILRSDAEVTLSWPVSYGRFVLQQNPGVANRNGWSDANYPLVTNGATKTATAPITTNQVFRLMEH